MNKTIGFSALCYFVCLKYHYCHIVKRPHKNNEAKSGKAISVVHTTKNLFSKKENLRNRFAVNLSIIYLLNKKSGDWLSLDKRCPRGRGCSKVDLNCFMLIIIRFAFWKKNTPMKKRITNRNEIKFLLPVKKGCCSDKMKTSTTTLNPF